MRKRAFFLFGFVGVICSQGAIAEAADSASPSDRASDLNLSQANEWFQKANSLYTEEKFHSAYIMYQSAWNLRHHYKIAANLGSCEYILGKYRDAAEHLAFSLRQLPRDVGTEERTYITERHAEAVKHVATLEIRIEEAGAADVFIDDTFIGRAPLDRPIYATPGPHTVHARNRIASAFKQVDLKKGESKTISLPVLPPPTRPPPPPEHSSTPDIILGFGGGLSLVLFSVGTTFSIVYPKNEAPSLFTAPTIDALSDGFLLAGMVGFTGTIVAVLKTGHEPQRPPIRVAPRVGLTANTWTLGVEANF